MSDNQNKPDLNDDINLNNNEDGALDSNTSFDSDIDTTDNNNSSQNDVPTNDELIKEEDHKNNEDTLSILKTSEPEKTSTTAEAPLEDEKTRVFNVVHDPVIEKPLDLPKPKKAKKSVWQRIKVVLAVIVIFIIIFGLVGVTVVGTLGYGMIQDAPQLEIDDFVSEESTKIYDGNHELVTEIGAYLRENIAYDDCPEAIVDAFLSIEDSRFFQHNGFDIPRFTKAILENLKSLSFGQGGSTFTMQLVKNTYFQTDDLSGGSNAEKKIDRKVQEIYLAMSLEQKIDKKTIFQLYLNKLNFGGNIRGVQKAAIYYFGKDVSALNLSECALLAGIINRPNAYNPYSYLDYATERRNTVLDMMQYHGYITSEECELAKSIKVEDLLVGENRNATDVVSSQYQSYIDTVIDEAQALTGKDPSVTGMTIYTYMEPEVQQQIEAIQNGETKVKFPDDLMQVAMISMNNQTGAIIGIGGGRNYDGARLLNRATANFKQPGSSVKPVLSYALAFEYLGWSLDQVVTDRPITYPGESRVLKNADGNYRGDITLRDAVGWSLNIPAILTLEEVVDEIGKEKVVEYMQSIGFSRVTNENFHLSYAIGGTTFETTVYELAGAHAAMINAGVYNKPHTIEKIVMQDGTTYYPEEQNRQVVSSGTAWLVCQLMQNNVSGPYLNYMQLLARDYPIYAKTGTTDWGSDGLQYGIPKGVSKDKWMVSSSSQYTNAVWVGYDKAVAGEQTYYTSAKSLLNIPGNINKLLLDVEDEIATEVPTGVTRPNDVDDITYIYGTYPYAKPFDGIDPSYLVTSQVAKVNEKDLVDINEHVPSNEFNGVSASIAEDGSLIITWSTGDGACSGTTKDISLHDQWNDLSYSGACLFDYSWLIGDSSTYGANVYVNDYQIATVFGSSGYYIGWPGDMYGTVKVCGWYGSGDYMSETKCTSIPYEIPAPQGWTDEWGNTWW